MAKRIRLRIIPHFVTDAGATVAFAPMVGMPGKTHRVIINRRWVDSLAEGFPPNAKAARYFIEKHPEAAAKIQHMLMQAEPAPAAKEERS